MGAKYKLKVVFELKDQDKPACIAEVLFLLIIYKFINNMRTVLYLFYLLHAKVMILYHLRNYRKKVDGQTIFIIITKNFQVKFIKNPMTKFL